MLHRILEALVLIVSLLMLAVVPQGVEAELVAPQEFEPAPVEAAPVDPAPPALLGVSPGDYMLTYTDPDTGYWLDYWLFIPDSATEDMPLIVFLHGDGEVDEIKTLKNFAMIKQAKEIYGQGFPFIAISPCTRTYSWITGNIPTTLKGLIDQTLADYSIDRVVITGHSRGAIGVWHMVEMYGEFFAAAVPVSCDSESPVNAANLVGVPIWGFVGGGDYYDYGMNMQALAADINELGGDAKITVLNNCTHGSTKTAAYTQELFEWMISQKGIDNGGAKN